jgi:DnaJ-class molecular chaperone
MSETHKTLCQHCDGTGEVLDYDALDIQVGQNEWVPTTKRQCPNCEGQGWKRANPPEEAK